ncbi:hypothetical protein [Anaerolentibacter hominis]|uniref:hypothetical protein n=1 Tax=Anaerolentibacter hominis TaxID=3079009 RepID=UPI0031B830A5
MGKVILCSGPIAKQPYFFKPINRNVYTLEELCYGIYQNIYVMEADSFDETLFSWLERELKEDKLAARLRHQKDQKEKENLLEELVGTILGACDYYTENEVKNTVYLMQKMEDYTPMEKRKMKGDNYLSHGKYTLAAMEYENILKGEEAASLRLKEYGNLKHNLAVAHLYTGSFHQAAKEFQEAYQNNEDPVSLGAYQEAVKLADNVLPDYIKNQEPSYENIDETIAKWKEEYRKAAGR